jgi:hypothetical protein
MKVGKLISGLDGLVKAAVFVAHVVTLDGDPKSYCAGKYKKAAERA